MSSICTNVGHEKSKLSAAKYQEQLFWEGCGTVDVWMRTFAGVGVHASNQGGEGHFFVICKA